MSILYRLDDDEGIRAFGGTARDPALSLSLPSQPVEEPLVPRHVPWLEESEKE